jgi:predicted methyltransferase
MSFHISRRSILLGAAALGFARQARAEDAALAAAIASAARSAKNVARDKYRHPAEVLEFFGLRDDLSVLEIQPGAGYWTEILAPYLAARGHYTVAVPPAPKAEQGLMAAYIAKLKGNPAYKKVVIEGFTPGVPLGPAGSQDLVLSFRNLHDWMADGSAAARLKLIYDVLKPGGVFGIEDHRGLTSLPQDPKAKSGYVREDYAKALIEAAGFRFVAESGIGDNPKDRKDYPKGVWTLPPTLVLGQVDRAKYLAIGESDRWTMKFIKPEV